jgi:hypothetical protein
MCVLLYCLVQNQRSLAWDEAADSVASSGYTRARPSEHERFYATMRCGSITNFVGCSLSKAPGIP